MGRYEVAGLPPGNYSVTFSKTGYIPQTIAITVIDTEPVHTLDVTLRGVNVTMSGSAPHCTAVDIVTRDGRPLNPPATATVRTDGSYRMARLPTPGEYRAVFRNGGSSTDFDVDAGETAVEADGACVAPTTMPCLIPALCPTTTSTPPPTTTTTVPVATTLGGV